VIGVLPVFLTYRFTALLLEGKDAYSRLIFSVAVLGAIRRAPNRPVA